MGKRLCMRHRINEAKIVEELKDATIGMRKIWGKINKIIVWGIDSKDHWKLEKITISKLVKNSMKQEQ
mgnify:FL=1